MSPCEVVDGDDDSGGVNSGGVEPSVTVSHPHIIYSREFMTQSLILNTRGRKSLT